MNFVRNKLFDELNVNLTNVFYIDYE